MSSVSKQPIGHRTIAVVVVCYNQAQFLDDALTSVALQTLGASEILLIDDGSEDNTAQIAARYPQVKYIHQENLGLSAARNTGLNIAKSEFILFLDSDDLLTPDALASALQALSEDPQRAFVYGGYREVTEDRTLIGVKPPVATQCTLNSLLRRGNFIAMHGTVLYNAEILRRAGGFDVRLASCEDFDVYLRLARNHPIGVYSSIAAEYRRHGSSLSRNMLRMIRTSRSVLRRHSTNISEREAARQGTAVMTSYYAERYWLSVKTHLLRREFRKVANDLERLVRCPDLWLPLLSWAFTCKFLNPIISRLRP